MSGESNIWSWKVASSCCASRRRSRSFPLIRTPCPWRSTVLWNCAERGTSLIRRAPASCDQLTLGSREGVWTTFGLNPHRQRKCGPHPDGPAPHPNTPVPFQLTSRLFPRERQADARGEPAIHHGAVIVSGRPAEIRYRSCRGTPQTAENGNLIPTRKKDGANTKLVTGTGDSVWASQQRQILHTLPAELLTFSLLQKKLSCPRRQPDQG